MTKRWIPDGMFIKFEVSKETWKRFKTLAESAGFSRKELTLMLVTTWIEEFEKGQKTVGSKEG